jgi:hypothetical protein
MNGPHEKFSFGSDQSDPLKPTFVIHNHLPRFIMQFGAGGSADFFPIAPVVSDEEYEPIKVEARKFWQQSKG